MTPLAARVAAAPGVAHRLVVDAPESLAAYRAAGGYAPLADPGVLLGVVDDSGLLGRGGAAFPLGVKLHSVIDHSEPGREPVVVANGEEGEPASVKDRWLLRNRPHLVLDGLRLAAAMVGAGRAVLYVSDPAAADSVRAALAEADLGVPAELVTVEKGYVAGEETAAVQAINGGPAKPTDKPPRPFESGVGGRPTLVSNVETLANLPFLQANGAHEYRTLGTPASPGTFLATIGVPGEAPGLYELPFGTSLTDLLALHGIEPGAVHGVLMGGYFAGLVNRRVLELTLDHEDLRRIGSGLGCGALHVITGNDCPVAVASSVMDYFDRENAGQCGSCFNGIAAMAAVVRGLTTGTAERADVDRLTRWSVVLRKRGACGTLDGAANLAASLLEEYPNDVQRHLAHGCEACRTTVFRAESPFGTQEVVPA